MMPAFLVTFFQAKKVTALQIRNINKLANEDTIAVYTKMTLYFKC